MSKELTVTKTNTEPAVWNTLKNSVYPGAKDESIVMVLEYCHARKLDPMLKPVHIVPMPVKDSSGNSVWRDVIMPGVGLYRITASRSGLCAGISEPEFGPDVTENIAGVSVTYPKWCKVTAKRRMNDGNNSVAEYTATEFWKENFASTKTGAPNSMWIKRAYGQLAKCSEAQALRKAFPDLIGNQVTSEEMEGKSFDTNDMVNITPKKETEDTTILMHVTNKDYEWAHDFIVNDVIANTTNIMLPIICGKALDVETKEDLEEFIKIKSDPKMKNAIMEAVQNFPDFSNAMKMIVKFKEQMIEENSGIVVNPAT
jgi:phage recombination protein Bet